VERGEIDPILDLELAAFLLRRLTANLHELIGRRLGISLEAAAHDVTLLSGPATAQLYDQIIQIRQAALPAVSTP